MNILGWLPDWLKGATNKAVDIGEFQSLLAEACYRELALLSAKQVIGNALSKCEIKFYKRGKEYRGTDWYQWNVEPNNNETSSRFMRRIVEKLCDTGECLVVELGGQLLIADSFHREPYATKGDIFTEVCIGADFQSRQVFPQELVLYWNIMDGKVSKVLAAVGLSWSKLLAYGMNGYQHSRGSKAKFTYDSLPPHITEEKANQWLQGQIDKYGKFLSADNGVVTVGKGTDLVEYGHQKTYSQEGTRDIRSMVGDIFDFTALAFGMPPAILRGDVQGTGDAVKSLLTFCIDPWADFIREEIVRKRLKAGRVFAGDDVIIDTRSIEHINPLEIARRVKLLISSGVYSVNEVRALLDEKRIEEDWADEHKQTDDGDFGGNAGEGGE